MEEPLPNRTREHVLETLSRQHLERVLPAEWVCTPVYTDYGLDVRVELVAAGKVSGIEFSIQLKATDKLKTSGGDVVHRCKVSTALYFLERLEPVMYLVYDAAGETAYWLWVQPYLEGLDESRPGWRKRKRVQIRVPMTNRLTAESVPLIEQHVRSWRKHAAPAVGWVPPPTPQVAGPPFTGREGLSERVSRRLKVFLCHASGDKPAVRELYHRLRGAGLDPWLDEGKLLPGQEWDLEIPKAVRSSDAVVICLSRRAVTKAGYVQKEIRYALDVADEQPEGAIFLIPLRLEECEVPQRLRRWQWVDFFHEKGYERLLRALRTRAKSLGLATFPFEPEVVLIPAGEFLMGSDPVKDRHAERWEQPQHTLHLPDYFLARTPVTNTQYAAFVQATGHRHPEHWQGGGAPEGRRNHPVVNVSWRDALAYCEWLSDVTGRPYGLPSEAEWEKGARGDDGRIYPWGDKWDPWRCNSKEAGMRGTTPVGVYPKGVSPYGLLDMAGNVWEWTRSLERGYPYDPDDGRENLRDADRGVTRGGSWLFDRWYARCAYRNWVFPGTYFGEFLGFRVCTVLLGQD